MNSLFAQRFSRNSLINTLGMITSSLRYARRMGWIEISPADDIDIPRERLCTENRKKVREPIPRDVLAKIFERFPEGHPSHVPLMIAYHCGLRLGEVFGLSWDDVDLEYGELTVNRQAQWVQEKAEYRLLPPKYGSVRTVRMDDVLWDLLKREKAKNNVARLGLGETYQQLYLNDDNDHNHWIIDEEAAAVVREIYKLTLEGYGPYQITRILREKKIDMPGVHLAKLGRGLHKNVKMKDPYNWSSSTIVGILTKREYLGYTVNFKTQKHFKDM